MRNTKKNGLNWTLPDIDCDPREHPNCPQFYVLFSRAHYKSVSVLGPLLVDWVAPSVTSPSSQCPYKLMTWIYVPLTTLFKECWEGITDACSHHHYEQHTFHILKEQKTTTVIAIKSYWYITLQKYHLLWDKSEFLFTQFHSLICKAFAQLASIAVIISSLHTLNTLPGYQYFSDCFDFVMSHILYDVFKFKQHVRAALSDPRYQMYNLFCP